MFGGKARRGKVGGQARDAGLWYPIEAMRRANVAVEVQWSWWTGMACLTKQKTGRYAWCTSRNGEIVILPEDPSWPEVPHCWRPVGESWPDPLPEPMTFLSRPGVETDHNGLLKNSGLVADPRDEAVIEAKKVAGREWWQEDLPFLREGTARREAVEYRLLRALAQVTPEFTPDYGQTTLVTMMLAEAQRDIEADPATDWRPGFKPTPADVKDFTVAMDWWTKLNPPEAWHKRREPWTFNAAQRTMIFRSRPIPLTFDHIASRLKMSGPARRRRAFTLYNDAVNRCWLYANGIPTDGHRRGVDHIGALRQRNRDYKNGANRDDITRR